VLKWIFKAKRFFYYYETLNEDHITIVAVHMEKDIVPWFQMVQRTKPFSSWTQFTQALETEFGPSPSECPKKALFKFQQSTTVSEYYLCFMALANRSPICLVTHYWHVFSTIKLHNSNRLLLTTLAHFFVSYHSKVFEECHLPHYKTVSSGGPNPKQFSFTQAPRTTNFNSDLIPAKPISQVPKSQIAGLLPTPTSHLPLIRRLSSTDMKLWRERGQYFTRDKRFSANHRCPNREVVILLVDEDNKIASLDSNPTLNDPLDFEHTHSVMHLSLHALQGGSDVDAHCRTRPKLN